MIRSGGRVAGGDGLARHDGDRRRRRQRRRDGAAGSARGGCCGVHGVSGIVVGNAAAAKAVAARGSIACQAHVVVGIGFPRALHPDEGAVRVLLEAVTLAPRLRLQGEIAKGDCIA